MSKLTTAHLFSGAGGDTEGAIAAGYKPLWAVEQDKYAAAIYRKRFPDIQLIEADVRKLTDEFVRHLSVPKILIAGSPCQDFSMAGREPDLLEFSRIIFLNSSDSYDYSSLRVSSLKMLPDCLIATRRRTSPLSCVASLRWGMWGHGKQGMEHTGHPKTETGFTVLVITGDVARTHISPLRRNLISCLEGGEAVIDRHQTGDRIYTTIAPTLRSQGGSGGSFRVKTNSGTRPLLPVEYERLMGWTVGSTELGIMNGCEVTISKCQRSKVLGNGMVPAEITDICLNLGEFFGERELQHGQL